MADIQFCNLCYFFRHRIEDDTYICVNGNSIRSKYVSIDFWQQSCLHAKPRDWRPSSVSKDR